MKVLYISKTRLDYSLNSVYIRGLRENRVMVETLHVPSGSLGGYFKALNFYREHGSGSDYVFIGFDSPLLAIFLRPFCRKKMVYVAFRSLYEGLIISRKLASPFSVKAVYYWLLDLVAVHLADLTVVESDNQAGYFKKLFKVPGKKIFKNWIGVNDENFFYDPGIKKHDTFTVLFRGALQPETGAEYVVQAAKLLEGKDIQFVMHVGGQLKGELKNLIDELRPDNVESLISFLPAEELRKLMSRCHVSLGQLSNHERLERTVPHKAYESLAMKLPYLTASNTGILELVHDGETCLTCKPADAESLADKIMWIKNNYSTAEKIAENGYQLYQSQLRPHILVRNLLDRIKQL